jgi:predicted translin family RNA/ssDNA-binding protein
MSLLSNSNLSDNEAKGGNFDNPEQMKEKLHEFYSKLPLILEDFKKSYVLYNKDTNYNEYVQTFVHAKSNLEHFNSELFMLENKVHGNIDKLNEHLVKLNVKIMEEKIENKVLKRKLGIMEVGVNSTDEMIIDYKKKYDLHYTHNWGLLLTIFIAWGAMAVVFAPQTAKIPPAK